MKATQGIFVAILLIAQLSGASAAVAKETRSFLEMPESLKRQIREELKAKVRRTPHPAVEPFEISSTELQSSQTIWLGWADPALVSRRLLPRAMIASGLNQAQIPANTVLEGEAGFYKIKVSLETTTVRIPWVDCTASSREVSNGSCPDRIDASWQDGNRMGLRWSMPGLRLETVLKVSAKTSVIVLPDYEDSFPLYGYGFDGQSAVQLRAENGRIEAGAYEFATARLSRAEIRNLGALRGIFDLLVSIIDVCEGPCETVDDWLLEIANGAIQDFVTGDLSQGVWRQRLTDLLRFPVQGAFEPWDGINTKIRLSSFDSSVAQGARIGFEVLSRWQGPAAECAQGLEPPSESSSMGPAPEFSAASPSEWDLALSPKFIERGLYELGLRGDWCGQGSFDFFSAGMSLDYRPVGEIQVAELGGGRIRVRVAMQFGIRNDRGTLIPVRSKKLRANVELDFALASSRVKGLQVELKEVRLKDVSGQLRIFGVPVSNRWLDEILNEQLAPAVANQWKVVQLLDPEIRLSEESWAGRLEMTEGASASGGWLRAGFRWAE